MGDKTEGFSSEDDVLGHVGACTESAGRGESESFVPLGA